MNEVLKIKIESYEGLIVACKNVLNTMDENESILYQTTKERLILYERFKLELINLLQLDEDLTYNAKGGE